MSLKGGFLPSQKAAQEWQDLYRFLDAGDAKTFRMRSRPASKKRRGAKSRDAGQQLGSERYGDLMCGPVRWGPLRWSEATCTPARGSGRESETGGSGGS
jgi:hypothetical protein